MTHMRVSQLTSFNWSTFPSCDVLYKLYRQQVTCTQERQHFSFHIVLHRHTNTDFTLSSLKDSDGYSERTDFVCVYIYVHPVNWARKMSFLQLAPILCMGIITIREKFFPNRISAISREKKKSQSLSTWLMAWKGNSWWNIFNKNMKVTSLVDI